MNTANKIAVAIVLLLPLSGCKKKTKTPPPPQAQAPVLPTSKMVHVPDLPALPPPPEGNVTVASTKPDNPEPSHPHKTTRRKPAAAKSAATENGPPTDKAAQTQVATNPVPEASSPIGQLSSSGEDGNSQGRSDIEKLITDTENGLNGIKRTLSSDEQLTSTQIRTFLTKAKQALAENDLDGAQTLAKKASVLLGELTNKK